MLGVAGAAHFDGVRASAELAQIVGAELERLRSEVSVPGFFLCFPSRAQSSAPLRLFVEAAKELALRRLS